MSDTFAHTKLTSTLPKKRGRKRKQDAPVASLTVSDVVGPRQAPPRPVYTIKSKWTTAEKKQLISALRACHSEEGLEKVYNMVPSRTQQEVAAEVLRLRNSVVQQGPELQTPIETWLDFALEMVHYEEEDLSRSMARAMSIVSNYESFPEPEDAMSPHYKQLYKYLTALLNGDDPPKLSPLDSAVMLDLMHSLTDVLSTTDTRLQRKVMKWKFSMLNCKVDINNLQDTAARTRRALTNVFPDDFSSPSQVASERKESNPAVPTSEQQKLSTTSTGQREATPGPSGDTTSEPPNKRGPGKVRKGDPPLEKPLLYSLNPFCVPVEVLKLRPKKRLLKS